MYFEGKTSRLAKKSKRCMVARPYTCAEYSFVMPTFMLGDSLVACCALDEPLYRARYAEYVFVMPTLLLGDSRVASRALDEPPWPVPMRS